jgi:hypothetical protein
MSKEFLWMQLKEKLLISLGHIKASKLYASFLVRKNLARKSFYALLTLNLLFKLRSLSTPCKVIASIEMTSWAYNFLMQSRITKITTTFLLRAAALLVLHPSKDPAFNISIKVLEIKEINLLWLLEMMQLLSLSCL